MENGKGLVNIDKLTDSKFYVWKQRTQFVLAVHDLDEYIENEGPLQDTDNYNVWVRASGSCRAIFSLFSSDGDLEHNSDCTVAKIDLACRTEQPRETCTTHSSNC